MRNAYIKFRTRKDRAVGCEELIAHSNVSRLSGDIYCIPWLSLGLLDACRVDYTFADQDDLTNARPPVELRRGQRPLTPRLFSHKF